MDITNEPHVKLYYIRLKISQQPQAGIARPKVVNCGLETHEFILLNHLFDVTRILDLFNFGKFQHYFFGWKAVDFRCLQRGANTSFRFADGLGKEIYTEHGFNFQLGC